MNRDPQQRLAEFEDAALGFADQLFRVALRVVRDREHEEDLVQETYLHRVAAYQTTRRVALVVSRLSEAEGKELAESLAAPASAHLRHLENAQPTPAATVATR